MKKLSIGLVGLGNVGSGFIKLLNKRKNFIKSKYGIEFVLKMICDRSINKKIDKVPNNVKTTTTYQDVIKSHDVDIVIELIGGMNPAKGIVVGALKNGKHVITANKELIANAGDELFRIAQKNNRSLYFESSVGAGIPIIKTLSEGLSGNTFNAVYGIINGTCNYILTEMTKNKLSFKTALENAQKKGFAEPNPTLDINGMHSAHKLAILVYLAFGKQIPVKKIHTEGITHISHLDIEYAENLNLTIKLLAIAKKNDSEIEARVHPTLIVKDHPLAAINSIYNAVYLNANPMEDILLSGEGAGQMAAASGVLSDLINIGSKLTSEQATVLSNVIGKNTKLNVRKMDDIQTKFYFRFMASDKSGVLAQIAGILGEYNISINSVTQRVHQTASTVPVVMLSEKASEKNVRLALEKIQKMSVVKSKPVAIRMESLP